MQVAFLILCRSFQMFLQRYRSFRLVMMMSKGLAWGFILSTNTLLLLTYFPHINLMEVIWGNQFIYKNYNPIIV